MPPCHPTLTPFLPSPSPLPLPGVYEPVSWFIKACVVSVAGLSTRSFLTLGVTLHALTTLLVFLVTRRLLQLALPLAPKGSTPNHLDEGQTHTRRHKHTGGP